MPTNLAVCDGEPRKGSPRAGTRRDLRRWPAPVARAVLVQSPTSEEETRMHQIFFTAKRAHWGCQNKMRKPLKKKFDITAGRVDMLHAISKDPWPQLKEQRRLVQKLGCVRSVVSRMLKAMEKLGWVSREKAEYDRRMWLVSLTKKGRHVLDRVMRSYVNSGVAAVWVYKALAGELWRKKGYRHGRVMFCEDVVSWLRHAIGGGGCVELYPFGHPDS